MGDTAEQTAEEAHGRAASGAGQPAAQAGEPAAEESAAMLRYKRRRIVHRTAGRVLSRTSAPATIRERLALLDAAGDVYDLDESADIYGNGVVVPAAPPARG